MSDRSVHVSGLSRRFGATTVLSNLTLDVARGEFVALLGRSGSGKTTLLRTLAGLDEPGDGTVVVPERRAVVFQEPRLLPWKRVWENVTIGLCAADARSRAHGALSEVELGHRADVWPLTLSGGEAQRAGIARAIVREPHLLLLDEPFASIDALTRLHMHGLLVRLWTAHRPAVLLVTHDVEEAIALADRALVLDAGRIIDSVPILLRRPRDPAQPAFGELRNRLLTLLGVRSAGIPANLPALDIALHT